MQTQVNWKIILLCFVLFSGLLSVLAFGQYKQTVRSKASGTVVLRLSPGEKISSRGETLDISLLVDTKEDAVSAVDLFLAFDMTKIQLTGVKSSEYFSVTLLSPVSENGFIHTVLATSPSSPFRGTGIVATMRFQAVSDGETLIALTDQSMVAAIGKTDNVLSQTYPSLITIRSSTGPTATPAPTRSITPTPSEETTVAQKDSSIADLPEPTTSPGFIGFGVTPRLPAESEYTIPGQYTPPESPFPSWLDAFFQFVAGVVCLVAPCGQ